MQTLEDILTSIIDDFGKYAKGKDLALIQKIFRACSHQIGRKVKYVNLDNKAKAHTISQILSQLYKARLLHPVIHSGASGIPLHSQTNEKIFKILFSDIGLLCRILGLESIPNDTVIEGVLAEQFIGQELKALYCTREKPLYYWLREGKANNAEIDYVIQKDTEILAVEVKAGHVGKLSSLHQIVATKNLNVGYRFYMGEPSVDDLDVKVPVKNGFKRVQYKLYSYPLFDCRRWATS